MLTQGTFPQSLADKSNNNDLKTQEGREGLLKSMGSEGGHGIGQRSVTVTKAHHIHRNVIMTSSTVCN